MDNLYFWVVNDLTIFNDLIHSQNFEFSFERMMITPEKKNEQREAYTLVADNEFIQMLLMAARLAIHKIVI